MPGFWLRRRALMNQVGFEDPKGDMVYLSSLFLCRINAFHIFLFRGLSFLVTGTRQVASRVIGLIAVSELATCLKVINTAGPETRGIFLKRTKESFLCQHVKPARKEQISRDPLACTGCGVFRPQDQDRIKGRR